MRTRRAGVLDLGGFMESTRENLPLLLLGGVFILGVFCGSGMYSTMNETTSNTLMFLLSGSGADTPFHFWSDWGAVFLTNFLLMAVLFLCGFCAISQPVILLIPFVKGLGFGLVAAYNMVLLSPYSAFFWVKFLPGAFLGTVLLLLCAKQSLALSVYVYRAVFAPQPKEGRLLPKFYGGKYLIFTALCGAFSLIDALFDLAYEVISNG